MSKNKNTIFPLLSNAFQTIKKHPVTLFPLAIAAFLELWTLELIYFLPRWPLNSLFAPIVRTLWGEGLLHYPRNFFLMYKLFYYAQIAIYLLAGGYLTAVTCAMFGDINADKKLNLKEPLKKTAKRYLEIFCIVLISTICFFIIRSAYNLILNFIISNKFHPYNHIIIAIKKALIYTASYAYFFLNIFIGAAFAYCLPLIVLENKKIFQALKYNFILVKNNFITTFVLILIPALFVLPLLYLNNNASVLMDKIFPEAVFLLLSGGIILSLFINTLIIALITQFYLNSAKVFAESNKK